MHDDDVEQACNANETEAHTEHSDAIIRPEQLTVDCWRNYEMASFEIEAQADAHQVKCIL